MSLSHSASGAARFHFETIFHFLPDFVFSADTFSRIQLPPGASPGGVSSFPSLRGRLAEAADEFCARVAPAKIPEIVAFLLGDVSAARLAQAHAMRRSGAEASKNAPSPAE